MAIRLSGSISRKLPIEGVQFSSQSFGASMDVEINSDDPAEVQKRLQQLYASLSASIDHQIASAMLHPGNGSGRTGIRTAAPRLNPPPQSAAPAASPAPAPVNGNGSVPVNRVYSNNRTGRAARTNGNGNGQPVLASQAQQRAIHAITRNLGLDVSEVLSNFNYGPDVAQLPMKVASQVIDSLKSQQNGNAAPAQQ